MSNPALELQSQLLISLNLAFKRLFKKPSYLHFPDDESKLILSREGGARGGGENPYGINFWTWENTSGEASKRDRLPRKKIQPAFLKKIKVKWGKRMKANLYFNYSARVLARYMELVKNVPTSFFTVGSWLTGANSFVKGNQLETAGLWGRRQKGTLRKTQQFRAGQD